MIKPSITLPIEPSGNVYVPIRIRPPRPLKTRVRRVRFMLDTGAVMTVIKKKELIDLGYSMEWLKSNTRVHREHEKVRVASGEAVPSGEIALPQIEIGGLTVENHPFLILTPENIDFATNLLGQDLLTRFDYTFMNSTKTFTAQKARP